MALLYSSSFFGYLLSRSHLSLLSLASCMISSSVASTFWNNCKSVSLSVGISPQRRQWLVMAKISWMTFVSLFLSIIIINKPTCLNRLTYFFRTYILSLKSSEASCISFAFALYSSNSSSSAWMRWFASFNSVFTLSSIFSLSFSLVIRMTKNSPI